MSLPLSRRIAQAALLVAAGTAPLAAAGAASAAELVPHGTDLGSGISKLDGVTSASTIKGEAHQVGQALGKTGSVLAGTAIPATADVAGMAAADTLPGTDQATKTLADPGSAVTNATTNGSGPLADTLGKVTRLTPLGHLLPAAAPRSMPLGADNPAAMPLAPGQAPALHAPAAPSITGLDKLVPGDALSNPLGTAHHLTQVSPATSGLADQLPSQDRLTAALPTADHLTSALPTGLDSTPSTQQLGNAVPHTAPLAEALPATHGLAPQLTAADQLTHAVPADADLAHPDQALDATHLAALEGQATGATHRLGSLPDLSGVSGLATSLGGGVTNALHHLPSVS